MRAVREMSSGIPSNATSIFDVAALRRDFPILQTTVHGKPLVYLDNAATSQKPQAVLDALARYYAETNANVHRGLYQLSEASTRAYDAARPAVERLLVIPT